MLLFASNEAGECCTLKAFLCQERVVGMLEPRVGLMLLEVKTSAQENQALAFLPACS